jgi:DNA primase
MAKAKQIHDHIPTWLDAVNRNISIVQLLEHLDVAETLNGREGILVGRCPLHNGNSPDEFYVYSKQNSWACYGNCHRGGNPLDFVALKEGVSYPTAALLLQAWFCLDLAKLQLPRSDDNG